MSTTENIPTLVGEQKTTGLQKSDGKYHAIHFCVMQPGKRQEMIRIMVKDGQGYDSLREAINTLPEPTEGSVMDLQKQIAHDLGFGFGEHYPEYSVVAKSNNYIYDKPFAEYITASGDKKIVKHPNVDRMVKRVKWSNYV